MIFEGAGVILNGIVDAAVVGSVSAKGYQSLYHFGGASCGFCIVARVYCRMPCFFWISIALR